MPYQKLFDKHVIGRQFNSCQLLKLLVGNNLYPINHEIIRVNKQDVILKEGNRHKYMYFIQSGLFSVAKEGRIKGFLKESEVIGMTNILVNEESSFTVTALTGSLLLRFTKEDVMLKLVHLQEGLFFLYNDIKIMNQYMIQRDLLQVTDAKDRIKVNIAYLGKLYGKEDKHHIILPKVFTKKIISNFVNVTSTTVYKICRELEEEGFLGKDGQDIEVNKENAVYELAIVDEMNKEREAFF
ncbi:Crp/Fnr family transcriptional regulator [Listeria riparia]|uniref:Cyclic nucleotide-binding domain-containing protein n=1 Tax=Listeria riparia FSL S10-1204 TaxID=1265816 RepID=W7D1K2_9LIST|nr:Crp/Fnr family transcriptional regulator [Listeria riparia]EUJ42835.1 hypothetical protein PRIP_14897 [Listeria riparia FSL S10-1204]